MNFRDYISEGNFHPVDVFQDRFVITDGKDIINPESGEVLTIKQYKDDMKKKIKKHDQHDDVYFPTEKLAKEAFKKLGSSGKFKVQKLSYS